MIYYTGMKKTLERLPRKHLVPLSLLVIGLIMGAVLTLSTPRSEATTTTCIGDNCANSRGETWTMAPEITEAPQPEPTTAELPLQNLPPTETTTSAPVQPANPNNGGDSVKPCQ
jgi:hypothetical protein